MELNRDKNLDSIYEASEQTGDSVILSKNFQLRSDEHAMMDIDGAENKSQEIMKSLVEP